MREQDIDTRNEGKNISIRLAQFFLTILGLIVIIVGAILLVRFIGFKVEIDIPPLDRRLLLLSFAGSILPLAFFALREMGAWGWIPRLWLIEKTAIISFSFVSGTGILSPLIQVYSPYAFAILFLITDGVLTVLVFLRMLHDRAPKTLEKIAEWDGPTALSAKPELLEQAKSELERG